MPDLIANKIISRITAHASVDCEDFAELLLKDTTTVNKLRNENTSNDKFVRAVLRNWLSRNDDDPKDPTDPRTWESLAQCMELAGLEGVLVKHVRDTFC